MSSNEELRQSMQLALNSLEKGDVLCEIEAASILRVALSASQSPCLHRRYSVETDTQTGKCLDCGSQGRLLFVAAGEIQPNQTEHVTPATRQFIKELRQAAEEGREQGYSYIAEILHKAADTLTTHKDETTTINTLRRLLETAMQTMKNLQSSVEPDESTPDIDARVPGAAYAVFVDAHAKLLFDIKHAPTGGPPPPQQLALTSTP